MPANGDLSSPLRVLMVTPHLPPEWAANAILPVQLGSALDSFRTECRFLAHASRDQRSGVEHTYYVPRRGRGRWWRTKIGALIAAVRIAMCALPLIKSSDVIHLHGNGLIVEIADWLASRLRKPRVLTLYGTDVWHHDETRHWRFGSVVRNASSRVFYSEALREFADNLGLAPEPSAVIYAPVASTFRSFEMERRSTFRKELGLDQSVVLLTVKRLHPVAGHEDLLRAMPVICSTHKNVRLLIIGEGESRAALEALTKELNLTESIQFLGGISNEDLYRYYVSADLFVLPSRLESWGTVMLEALACGTPVVTTQTAGGQEIAQLFPADVRVAAVDSPADLARAVRIELETYRRVSQDVQARFSIEACARNYHSIYCQVIADSGQSRKTRLGI